MSVGEHPLRVESFDEFATSSCDEYVSWATAGSRRRAKPWPSGRLRVDTVGVDVVLRAEVFVDAGGRDAVPVVAE